MARTRLTRPPPAIGRAEIEFALDALAAALKLTGNRKLLPIYQRLEHELDALDNDDLIMQRALKRRRRQERAL